MLQWVRFLSALPTLCGLEVVCLLSERKGYEQCGVLCIRIGPCMQRLIFVLVSRPLLSMDFHPFSSMRLEDVI